MAKKMAKNEYTGIVESIVIRERGRLRLHMRGRNANSLRDAYVTIYLEPTAPELARMLAELMAAQEKLNGRA